jgi:phosphatidylserine/phosphatidylglycerophosphate/cardiolipin synthase-like enzyme
MDRGPLLTQTPPDECAILSLIAHSDHYWPRIRTKNRNLCHRRPLLIGGALLVASLALAACTRSSPGADYGVTPAASTTATLSLRTTTAAPRGPSTTNPGSSNPQLVVEPDDTMAPIYTLITSATSSLDMTMFELNDTIAESDLAADAARGVDVRVLLDAHLEAAANAAAASYLSSHHVAVAWGPSDQTLHQKTITVDNHTSAIMTLNLTSRYYVTTRDFVVIDTNPSDVHAIATTFDADFSGSPSDGPPSGADLVWSPGSAAALLMLISRATHSLVVENEEMDFPAITAALCAAAQRGVHTEIVMTEDSDYDSAFNQLKPCGVRIFLYPDTGNALYIHAKAIDRDPGYADAEGFVGSENFSTASLDYNRELGIITTNAAVLDRLASVLAHDAAGATPY